MERCSYSVRRFGRVVAASFGPCSLGSDLLARRLQTSWRDWHGRRTRHFHALSSARGFEESCHHCALWICLRWCCVPGLWHSLARWKSESLKLNFVSLHLPHRRISLVDYTTTFSVLREALLVYRGAERFVLGADTNTLVGNSVLPSFAGLSQEDADKLTCLAEFLFEFDLRGDNTWTEVAMPTRRSWSSVKHPLATEGEEETHMDFLLSSSTIGLEECFVEQAFDFISDPWPVVTNYILSTPNMSSRKQFKRCPVNWSPSESWGLRVDEFLADWSDPLSVLGQWAQIARECRLPVARKFDFQDNLQDLLRLRRQHLDPDWRRQVNRAIYRTRRKRKRFVRFQALQDACTSGRAPPVQSKGGHVNWGRLFGNVSPAEALLFHYSAIFEFDSLEEAAQESAVRQSVMHSWHSRPVGTHEFACDLPQLRGALKRLHLGKSSPDGLTA